jgi:predicted aspartyl protease
MGQVMVPVTVTNVLDPTRELFFTGMVDTGAFGLVLPLAWRERLGALPVHTTVELETADQRVVTADLCAPVMIQVAGFRPVTGEVAFIDMQESPRGYEPLVGYTVLELAGVVVDLVTHRLIARKYYDLKAVRAASPRLRSRPRGTADRGGPQTTARPPLG